MEFTIALILFAVLIVAWGMLPGTNAAAVTTEETTNWAGTDAIEAAIIKA